MRARISEMFSWLGVKRDVQDLRDIFMALGLGMFKV